MKRIRKNARARRRWKAARVLVVDEVSMLQGTLFAALDAVGRAVRGSDRPFGGLQLLLCGDFYQLPPVGGTFAFGDAAWRAAGITTIELIEVIRQRGDSDFCALLNSIRVGVCTQAMSETLAACHVDVKPLPKDGVEPTSLYCKNKNVDAMNAKRLAALTGKPHNFVAKDVSKGGSSLSLLAAMDREAPSKLTLKVGAQVMLTRNWPAKRLVNGSRGVVIAFVDGSPETKKKKKKKKQPMHPRVRFACGRVHTIAPEACVKELDGRSLTRTQLPLKLAWVLTVHKAQGMTLTRCELDVSDAFASGQAYVALSRVTSLAGLWVSGGLITQRAVKAHPLVREFYGHEDVQPEPLAAAGPDVWFLAGTGTQLGGC
eukprot:TRINITY_DN4802_c0_g1_i1.p1 TRINITY_DN4802_c0_g1~~TRINITY_DN4802_c0_g1_i1.p1  ORF type:complete len:372 (+),score=118.05 TRINITY_DN4802_c0_g1_i1:2-1117(+)